MSINEMLLVGGLRRLNSLMAGG